MKQNQNTGKWELEDDSPTSVRAVEEGPRAAYTEDDPDSVASRINAAIEPESPLTQTHTPITDSYTLVWENFRQDQLAHLHENGEDHGEEKA